MTPAVTMGSHAANQGAQRRIRLVWGWSFCNHDSAVNIGRTSYAASGRGVRAADNWLAERRLDGSIPGVPEMRGVDRAEGGLNSTNACKSVRLG